MKLPFLGRGPESQPLQLYGKLPVAKDYLRIGCGDGSARELREWLDRTFGTVREEPLVLSEPLRFLGLADRDPLQGYLWPSTDAGGHRKFPFTLLVERRRKSLLADLEAGNLTEAEGAWRRLAELRERCMQAADGQELLAQQRGTDVTMSEEERTMGAPADFDAWLACLWPEESLEGLFELFARLIALARGGHAGPYRLPLARALPHRDQVVAWVHVLRRVGALPRDEVPTLFFPPRSIVPSSEHGSVVVSAGALRDDQVAWLSIAGGDDDLGPADLAHGVGGDDGAASPAEGERWLRETLLEVLASYEVRSA